MDKRVSTSQAVLVATVLGVVIYVVSRILSQATLPELSGIIDLGSIGQRNLVFKSYMLLLTLLAMYIFRSQVKDRYGFQAGTDVSYWLLLRKGVLFCLLGLACLIFLNVIGFLVTRKRPAGFAPDKFLNWFLYIWIWSSVVEEILFRGLLQSYLSRFNQKLFTIRKAVITPAVFVPALLFAAMHLTLFMQGMAVSVVAGIFINALILGLLAGYYREKTGSIYPAIFLHILFNVIGYLPVLLQR
ncbi:MAG TPA: type II CAAX endopeptidase family protein [Chitinophagaceae bacterium]|jgi:membrane protease YdiL (CAAX protease family)|nr:type II CAAX endopeptidase family protein [Chitinophagaceae bacterium]